MQPQTVIVYHSRLEQETSEFWAPYIPYLAMAALVVVLGVILYNLIFNRGRRY